MMVKMYYWDESDRMTEIKRFLIDDAGELIDLNNHKFIDYGDECCKLLNELNNENKKLKQDLKNCKKLAGKRLNKNRNHRAVIEDLGGSIRAYKGQISQLNEKIEKIQEAMEDTGALTKRQLEEILND